MHLDTTSIERGGRREKHLAEQRKGKHTIPKNHSKRAQDTRYNELQTGTGTGTNQPEPDQTKPAVYRALHAYQG